MASGTRPVSPGVREMLSLSPCDGKLVSAACDTDSTFFHTFVGMCLLGPTPTYNAILVIPMNLTYAFEL